MTSTERFEEIGVEMQYSSLNAGQAKKQFERSCDICSGHGMHLFCPQCHIKGAHVTVMEQRFGVKVEKDGD